MDFFARRTPCNTPQHRQAPRRRRIQSSPIGRDRPLGTGFQQGRDLDFLLVMSDFGSLTGIPAVNISLAILAKDRNSQGRLLGRGLVLAGVIVGDISIFLLAAIRIVVL